MNNLKLALRNLLRNGRRTAMTAFTIAVGTIAMLLLGGFIANIYYGMQTGIVRSQGHLHIYPVGYLDFGSSRTTDFYIEDYQLLIQKLIADPLLKSKVRMITPVVDLSGIAGNYVADTSKTFIGKGIIPADYNRMQTWDSYGLDIEPSLLAFSRSKIDQGVIGVGMARMLNLCDALKLADCRNKPKIESQGAVVDDIRLLQSLSESEDVQPEQSGNQIDILASTGSGAPNAVSIDVIAAQKQGNKVLDDSLILMHLSQAQKLVFTNDRRASAIVIQLVDSSDMINIQTYLEQVLNTTDHGQARFEVKTLDEFNTEFLQVMNMFFVIFMFVTLVICLVVLFTTINTLTMSVMERISEIGSLRAMGLRRSAIRSQFLLEGTIIGTTGATLGLLAAILLTLAFNNIGINWLPPGSAQSRPLEIQLFSYPLLTIVVWSLMVAVATLSSIVPARKASKMNIVDAIRSN